MEVSTAIWIAAAVLGGAFALLLLGAFVLVAAVVAYRFFARRATAAGVDLSDGIDAREWAIIAGLVNRYRSTAEAQRVAVDLVNAAQTSLAASIPRDATGAAVPPVKGPA